MIRITIIFLLTFFATAFLASADSLSTLEEIKWRTVKLWDYKTNVSGTGILLDAEKAMILTNRHVCNAFNDHIQAQFYDKAIVEIFSKKTYPTDETVDLCMLRFKTLIPSKLNALVPKDSVSISFKNDHLGAIVLYSGFPYREYTTVRMGRIIEDFEYKEKTTDPKTIHVQLINSVTGSGGSGSGVYTEAGTLVGVVFAFMSKRGGPKEKEYEGQPTVIVPQPELIQFLREVGFVQ